MNDNEKQLLVDLRLAPYIQKATALIGKTRKVGGNQFRHAMATLAILIDYHYTYPVLLKASVIHDLFEDIEGYDPLNIIIIDDDGFDVVNLVMEVTKGNESKVEYLKRVKETATYYAKILKVADRISNLTDLHNDIFDIDYMIKYLNETEEFVFPMALEVDQNMAIEVKDLIAKRREMIHLILNDL